MIAIRAALIGAVLANSMTAISNNAQSSQLANRLAELTETGKATVHKEYREDTQTVTKNDAGDYVVHVESVIGQQNDNKDPIITKGSDDFVIPNDLIYDDAEIDKMWQEIWKQHNGQSEDSEPAYALPPAADSQLFEPVSDEWMLPAEWQIAPQDNIDNFWKDDFVIPDTVTDGIDYSKFADNYMNYLDFDDIWTFDEETGEWQLDPIKYEQKYGIAPYIESIDDDALTDLSQEIDALQQDIDTEQADIELQEELVQDLSMEKNEIEQEKELSIEDIVSIDPVTGNIKVDSDNYYKMFGVYPSFEETTDDSTVVQSGSDTVDEPAQDEWRNDYDISRPKRRNAKFAAFQDRMGNNDMLEGFFNDVPEPASAAAA